MTDPTVSWLSEHYDKLITGGGSVVTALALAAKKVLGLEKRLDDLERRLSEKGASDDRVAADISGMKQRLEELMVARGATDARLQSIEEYCEDIKDDLRDIRRAVLEPR